MKENNKDEKLDLEVLFMAMIEAKKAFSKKFKDEGVDEAYFDLSMTGYVLALDSITKLKSITLKTEYDDKIQNDK